ncbi:MAG: hypothetical protein NC118_03540 [Eubacterium sp.]|nr:hypothetical protein [Eubacterium sp.]
MEDIEKEIIKKRVGYEKQKYSSLDTGMYVCGDILRFIRIALFDELVSIIIPENFIEMPMQFQVVRYPSVYRPKIILTSLDMNVNLGFTMYAKEVEEKELIETINSMKNVIKKFYPDYRFFQMRKNITTKNPYCWFDFRSYALDDAVYNLYFVVLIDNKILQGNFNCLYKDSEDWKRVVLQIIEKIKWIGEK